MALTSLPSRFRALAGVPRPDREPLSGPPADAAGARCVSCGHSTDEPYCARCGERRAADRGYSLRHFAHETFETVTNVDGTAWRTVKALLARPGALTAAYMTGRRVGYMRPLQLFLIVNVLYFVWVGWAGERVFSTRLHVHFANTNYGAIAQGLAAGRRLETGETLDAYARRFDDVAATQAKSLVIVMVPAFACFVAAVQIRQRRYLAHHLVYALHVYTVLLLFAMAQRHLIVQPIVALSRAMDLGITWRWLDPFVGNIMVAALAAYNILALRGAYGERWRFAIPKGLILAFAMIFVLLVYRIVLFFTTFSAT